MSFDRSINAYRGCDHGCIYCYAWPTHAYIDLSPGLDFETKITFKPNAAQLLEQELATPGYVVQPIAMGTNTDPYQPVERQLGITRALLEVLLRCKHPVTITTKGGGIERDFDLIEQLARLKLISVAVSITALDSHLKRIMEPRAAGPTRRLDVIRGLHALRVPVAVMAALQPGQRWRPATLYPRVARAIPSSSTALTTASCVACVTIAAMGVDVLAA